MGLGQTINVTGWIMGVVPSCLLMLMIYLGRGEPWRVRNLILSILLVLFAAHLGSLFTTLMSTAEHLHKAGEITDANFSELKSSGLIWLATLPILVGGVGINVLSEFLLSKRPQ